MLGLACRLRGTKLFSITTWGMGDRQSHDEGTDMASAFLGLMTPTKELQVVFYPVL